MSVTRHNLTGYTQGCRCTVCRAAKTEAQRRYRAKPEKREMERQATRRRSGHKPSKLAQLQHEVEGYRRALFAHHDIATLSDDAIAESLGGRCQICARATADLTRRIPTGDPCLQQDASSPNKEKDGYPE